jgi:predicted ribosome quality control (RQC) complex YloA/Tae2 family protein
MPSCKMSKEETPRKQDSNELRADIKRLSKHSELLRETAAKNARQAEILLQRVKEIERQLAASQVRRSKKTSGRIY